MIITSSTKISELIKSNPAAIDAIVSINKHFEKLRNPLLRKILASRVTVADAAKIGGCTVNDFYTKLLPLGFKVNDDVSPINSNIQQTIEKSSFLSELTPDNTITLDVRADIASGNDPFQKIMKVISLLTPGRFMLIINSFEPAPLINILKKKGFEAYTHQIQHDLFHTYFKNNEHTGVHKSENTMLMNNALCEFDEMYKKFESNRRDIDVRNLDMPMPMVTIINELETLQNGQALFVKHKKVPQFLLPELQERNFLWLIREDGEGDVKLLIYR